VRIRPAGDRAVLVEAGSVDRVHRLWDALMEARPEGIVDVVPGAAAVLVVTSGRADVGHILSGLDLDRPSRTRAERPAVSIPVVYDGPDLDGVQEATGLDRDQVVDLHSAATYRVDFLGFSPGFAYLSGGDPRLVVSRLPTPRTSVPTGSVALAAGFTAVYPQTTPGGWRLIGRTDAVLFDPRRDQPALFRPGDRVRFVPVDSVGPPTASPLRVPFAVPGRGAPVVEVLDSGPLLTVQDGGRPGWGHVGVPAAGALDRGAANRANRLVGNPDGAALLESTLGGCRLRLRAGRTVAITGATAGLSVDGLPARSGVGLPLPAGTELVIGPCRAGVRVYIAVSGGIDGPVVLGSRSTDTLSGLGPPPLRSGDRVGLGAPMGGSHRGVPPGPAGVEDSLSAPGVVHVDARLGPREEWLSPAGRATLADGDFVVAGSSDRTGVRLFGPPVSRAPGEIPPEGMVAGAVQLPPDGKPIVLMRNHPPTGGYPVVAVVDQAGVDRLAQAPPGTVMRFRFSS
jgi:KipI family sensor histidine kinase inhibitor